MEESDSSYLLEPEGISRSASEHETEKVLKLVTVWAMTFLVFSRFTNFSSQARVWKCFTHFS